MNVFAKTFLDTLTDVDGFILKSRSPSCGTKDVRIYPPGEKVGVIAKGPGMFCRHVQEKYSQLPIEDEGRLNNATIREHFLRNIYTNARFRKVKEQRSIQELIHFHTSHKFMFMAYNQQQLKQLGTIVANQNKQSIEPILNEYEHHLHKMFQRSPRCTQNINVLMHAFGYFKNRVSPKEKTFFLESLDKYRNGQVSLASIINVMKSWIIRFEEPYLSQQLFFSPYPEELLHPEDIDSCFTRNYYQ